MVSSLTGAKLMAYRSGCTIFFTFRTTHCDVLMRNLGCGFSRPKLEQNLGKELTPNRVKAGCREV